LLGAWHWSAGARLLGCFNRAKVPAVAPRSFAAGCFGRRAALSYTHPSLLGRRWLFPHPASDVTSRSCATGLPMVCVDAMACRSAPERSFFPSERPTRISGRTEDSA
jgi:hypothetical protein